MPPWLISGYSFLLLLTIMLYINGYIHSNASHTHSCVHSYSLLSMINPIP